MLDIAVLLRRLGSRLVDHAERKLILALEEVLVGNAAGFPELHEVIVFIPQTCDVFGRTRPFAFLVRLPRKKPPGKEADHARHQEDGDNAENNFVLHLCRLVRFRVDSSGWASLRPSRR